MSTSVAPLSMTQNDHTPTTKPARELAVIILAAGKGTRMKSNLPKVLHKIAGVPMIGHIIQTAEHIGAKKIITVIAPDMDDVAAVAVPHDTVIQAQQLGTGHAIKTAVEKLGNFNGDVVVMLGDVPLVRPATLKALIDHHRVGKFGTTILAMAPPNPTGYGRVFQNPDGTLKEIVEEKDASDEQRLVKLVGSGLAVYDGEGLIDYLNQLRNNNAQKEYYMGDIPVIMAQTGRASGVIRGDYLELRGVNSRAQLAELETAWQQRKRAEIMDGGVTLLDPATVYFSPDTTIESDVTIGPNVVFGPAVHIKTGAEIKAFCHIEGTVIESGASIGPFARLRPGTTIGQDAKIGNFVEVKNSDIKIGAKANHLGYIGDAVLGAHSNFGCGAITVNYDGKTKSKTIIGDYVMVGSNSALIAPITIEDGAYVAAGSTLTHNVPKDALAIARARQETLEDKGKGRLKRHD